jgi:NTP pyrophosphatase (non-canonical NTP hydrolase)
MTKVFFSPMPCKECGNHYYSDIPGHPEHWECNRCGHPNDAPDKIYNIEAFDNYQTFAKTTAVYPTTARVYYPALGLAGEAGEVANKVKKILRDANGRLTDEMRVDLLHELGDVLWYVAMLAEDLGANLSEVVTMNIHKLTQRKQDNTIGGSGDGR